MDQNQSNSNPFLAGFITLAFFFTLLLIILLIPIVNIVAFLFLPFPFILHIYKHGLKSTALVGILALFITMIYNPILGLFTLVAGSVGMVMGYFYQQKKGALAPIMAGMLTYLFNYLLIFIISVYVFNFNVTDMMQANLDNMMEMHQAAGGFLQLPLDENQVTVYKEYIEILTSAFPALMITSAIVMTGLHHMIQWRVLRKMGYEVDTLPPFREWRFPKSILWYYLVSLLLLMFGFMEPGTALFPTLFNLQYILEIIIFLQGLAVIAYFSYHKRMGKMLPILTVILTLFIPQIMVMVVRLIGIFEFGFGLRSRIKTTKEK
ncbi:YybS family protein [Caldalkalibacillus mannanilyticus]|uniref:YybS family protein n=1 Tax=Caldalkalibacillus mannanilyticus TaxID=1418 RepID=UPI00046ADEDF|nr:YybS family protein [Caldalkalibacillus mannanilyticus]